MPGRGVHAEAHPAAPASALHRSEAAIFFACDVRKPVALSKAIGGEVCFNWRCCGKPCYMLNAASARTHAQVKWFLRGRGGPGRPGPGCLGLGARGRVTFFPWWWRLWPWRDFAAAIAARKPVCV